MKARDGGAGAPLQRLLGDKVQRQPWLGMSKEGGGYFTQKGSFHLT